ncbi:uncharacterized protein EI90DRAFT_3042343 [Cantharellus anzutake]|uniref:uncharacterized protein n=1 Tax=Cantharellus anzutake TaxID=1750568 RepID=UPI0019053D98|nr:uncharacterized protein EI90DRAFT_3042343 [Cantharellus anzutake]KAF8338272.1 hypothetical protein EI90DRAFT_3042343 [Cantharellus anzutake]
MSDPPSSSFAQPESPPLETPFDPSRPTFLSHLSSIYAHNDSPPFTAVFTHSIPGPAHGVRSDCYWYPPSMPFHDDTLSDGGVNSEDSTEWNSVLRGDVAGGALHFTAGFEPAAGTVDPGNSRDAGEPYTHSPSGGGQSSMRPRLQLVIDPERSPSRIAVPSSVRPTPEVTILIFVPGNPGLVQFYLPFLDAIRTRVPEIGILAKSHLGHSPRLNNKEEPCGAGDISVSAAGLEVQVDSVIEVVDRVYEEYESILRSSEEGAKLNIVLMGHSVGTWIITEVLKARPDVIDGSFLLFPALCDLALTPNGRRLKLLFTPISAYIFAALAFVLFSVILPPKITISLIKILFSQWPQHQQFVLRSLLRSPRAVFSSLKLARDEMRIIRALAGAGISSGEGVEERASKAAIGIQTTRDVLRVHAKRIWVYYAFEGDGWVDERERLETFRALREGGGAANYERLKASSGEGIGEVVFGDDVPHDFCINHEQVVADQCVTWLVRGGFASHH